MARDKISDNMLASVGAKILAGVNIANDVEIGANCVGLRIMRKYI